VLFVTLLAFTVFSVQACSWAVINRSRCYGIGAQVATRTGCHPDEGMLAICGEKGNDFQTFHCSNRKTCTGNCVPSLIMPNTSSCIFNNRFLGCAGTPSAFWTYNVSRMELSWTGHGSDCTGEPSSVSIVPAGKQFCHNGYYAECNNEVSVTYVCDNPDCTGECKISSQRPTNTCVNGWLAKCL